MLLSYAGHVADMISRLKNNRNQRNKKGYFPKDDHLLLKEKHRKLRFRKVSRETESKFLRKIKLQGEKQRLYERILLITAVLVVLSFIWYLKINF